MASSKGLFLFFPVSCSHISVTSLEDPESLQLYRFNPLIDLEAFYQPLEYIPKKEEANMQRVYWVKIAVVLLLLFAGAFYFSVFNFMPQY